MTSQNTPGPLCTCRHIEVSGIRGHRFPDPHCPIHGKQEDENGHKIDSDGKLVFDERCQECTRKQGMIATLAVAAAAASSLPEDKQETTLEPAVDNEGLQSPETGVTMSDPAEMQKLLQEWEKIADTGWHDDWLDCPASTSGCLGKLTSEGKSSLHAILDYIRQLEADKELLQRENERLRTFLNECAAECKDGGFGLAAHSLLSSLSPQHPSSSKL